MNHRYRSLLLLVLALFSIWFGLATGSSDLAIADVLNALRGQASDLQRTLVLDIRLPRTLSGFIVGGLLALSGLLLQALLRNPLADPYV